MEMASTSSANSLDSKVKESEIRIAAFIAEHDLAFNVVEHLPQLIKAICPDSTVAKQIKCGRTKATAFVKNVLGKSSFEEIVKILCENKFSLIVGETTDKSCIKHLCMVARTIVNEEVKDCFLGILPVYEATAQALYQKIVSFFDDNSIAYKKNMIGFAADGANAMMGANHSLSTLLKKDIPSLLIMKCIWHSFALCASYACLKLPRGIEDLARDIYSYFSCSPK